MIIYEYGWELMKHTRLLNSNIKGSSIIEVVSIIVVLTFFCLFMIESMLKINRNEILLNSHEKAFDTMENLLTIAGSMDDYNTIFVKYLELNNYRYFIEEIELVNGKIIKWRFYFDEKYQNLDFIPDNSISYYKFEISFECRIYSNYESQSCYVKGSYYDALTEKGTVNFFKAPDITFRKKVLYE